MSAIYHKGRHVKAIAVYRTWFETAQEAADIKSLYGNIDLTGYEVSNLLDWLDFGDAILNALGAPEEIAYALQLEDGYWVKMEETVNDHR